MHTWVIYAFYWDATFAVTAMMMITTGVRPFTIAATLLYFSPSSILPTSSSDQSTAVFLMIAYWLSSKIT